MGEKRGACAHAPAGPVAAAARAAVRGVCAVGRPYRARPGVPHPCGAWALVPAVRRVPHGAGAAAVGSSGRAAGKRGSACFAASRYHLGRGARRALCPHGGRLCAPVGKGAALGGPWACCWRAAAARRTARRALAKPATLPARANLAAPCTAHRPRRGVLRNLPAFAFLAPH